MPGTRTHWIDADTRPDTESKTNCANDGRDYDTNDDEDFDDDADRAGEDEDPNDDGALDPDNKPDRGRRC